MSGEQETGEARQQLGHFFLLGPLKLNELARPRIPRPPDLRTSWKQEPGPPIGRLLASEAQSVPGPEWGSGSATPSLRSHTIWSSLPARVKGPSPWSIQSGQAERPPHPWQLPQGGVQGGALWDETE